MRFIASFRADSADLAVNELLRASPGMRQEEWLDPGTVLINADGEFSAVSALLRKEKPIFLRHISPVCEILELSGLEESALDIISAFSVRIRKTKGPNEASTAAARLIGLYEKRGGTYRRDEDGVILSGVLDGERLFLGVSSAEENLSPRAGGVYVFSAEGAISRAEGKLCELFEVFPGRLPKGGRALDLGAAPGGWTHVLHGSGFEVTAVDPAPLHVSLANAPGIEYEGTTAQEFLKNRSGAFDLITNDIKMDAVESAKLTCSFAPMLECNGYAVVTLKLPEKKKTAALKRALAVLETCYEAVFVKQLYSNRSEVTVAARKK